MEDSVYDWTIYIVIAFIYTSILNMIALKLVYDEVPNENCGYKFENKYEVKDDENIRKIICDKNAKIVYKQFWISISLAVISIIASIYAMNNTNINHVALMGVIVGSILSILHQVFFNVWELSDSSQKLFYLVFLFASLFYSATITHKTI